MRTACREVCAGAALLAVMSWIGAATAQNGLRNVVVKRSAVTERAAFLTGPDSRQPIRGRNGALLLSTEDFFQEYGSVFGMTDAAAQVRLERQRVDQLGWTTSTFQQMHEGVRVYSGVLKVQQNARREVMNAAGAFHDISPKLKTVPTLTEQEAIGQARQTISVGHPVITDLELVIVDPGWYGDRMRGAQLAYYVVLADFSAPYSVAFFVQAHTGEVLDAWSTIHAARDRLIYDAMGTGFIPGSLARSEGDPPTGDADVDAAYDYYGDTYDYFSRAFGRDSIDDMGLSMIATTHSTAPNCPNAYWNGEQMVFCSGTVTDDVVAHELTHGVTEYTAGLIYQNQSGQLNESFSDVFGEMVDLFNGDAAFAGPPGGTPWPGHTTGPGMDTPNGLRTGCSPVPGYSDGVRWRMGEDAAAFGGAIRDMWLPSCDGHPDSANDPLQGCFLGDRGGVHIGSGVPNHAFAILTDGATFNSISVTGIGPIKSGAVWYRALSTYLTPGSDFEDAYWALNQAATDLVGTSPNDPRTGAPSASMFTAFDAAQVDLALLAVEMNTVGLCGQSDDILNSDPAPDCSPSTTIYLDDFEGAFNWVATNSSPLTPYDWEVDIGPLPFLRSGQAMFIANNPPSYAGDESGTHSVTSPPINIPASLHFPVLRFTHLVQTERRWDGGRVLISVNSGAYQPIPAEVFFYNGYNDLLLNSGEGNTNPLAGELAFNGIGGEWGTSLAYLGDFISGGETINLRFEFGKDQSFGHVGWHVDDVEVLDCTAVVDCNNNGVPDALDGTSGSDDVVWSQPPESLSTYWSDGDVPDGQVEPQILAAKTRLFTTKSIEQVRLWGVYGPDDTPSAPSFALQIRDPDPGHGYLPGNVRYSEQNVSASRVPTGEIMFGLTVYEITLTLAAPSVLPAGEYWIEIYDDTPGDVDSFSWRGSEFAAGYWSVAYTNDIPPLTVNWSNGLQAHLSLELIATPPPPASTTMFVDPSAAGGGDGTTWASAMPTIQEALATAASNCIVQEIWVAEGIYKPGNSRSDAYELINGMRMYGGFPAGGGDGTFAARDPAEYETLLIGNIGNPFEATDNSFHVVVADGVDSSTVFDGFIMLNGYADGGGTDDLGGGMLIMNGADPQIVNCAFADCFALQSGGGVAVIGASDPNFENCIFSGCDSGNGGGIVITDGSNVDLVLCEFRSCMATGDGGGLHCSESYSIVDLDDASFEMCHADGDGGGIFIDNSASSSTIDGTTVMACTALGDGGGIRLSDAGLTIRTSNLLSNAASDGGAISARASVLPGVETCELTVRQTYFDSNSASDSGGGISTYGTGLTVLNSIFRNNTASAENLGGGALFLSTGTYANVLNNTIYENASLGTGSSGGGGGILAYLGAHLNLGNTILWGNMSNASSGTTESAQVRASLGGDVYPDYCIVEGWTGGLGGVGNSGDNPLLQFVPNVGVFLTPGSAAIDAGDSTLLPPVRAPEYASSFVLGTVDGPRSVDVSDIDGDGDPDLVAASTNDDRVTWFRNEGGLFTISFLPFTVTSSADGAYSVCTADMNNDGDMDILAASTNDDTIRWYENNGAFTPTFTPHVIYNSADGVRAIHAVDIDGDGDQDVLSASAGDSTIRLHWRIGGSTPTFITTTVYSGAFGASAVSAADVDGDGDQDILSCSLGDSTIRWYRNNGGGPPSFTPFTIDSATSGPYSVTSADLDADGDLDVIAASSGASSVQWYENNGASTPSFSKRTLTVGASGARSVAAADLDGDGDVDIVAGSIGDDRIRWFENDGAAEPEFFERNVETGVGDPMSIAIGDIDEDGALDVVGTEYTNDRLRWYRSFTPSPLSVTMDFDGLPRFVDAVNYDDTGTDNGMGQVIDIGAQEAPSNFTGPPPPLPGDANGDQMVDVNDLNQVIGNFGSSGGSGMPGDVTGDGSVDINDLNQVLGNFGVVGP